MEAHDPRHGSETTCWPPVPKCLSISVDFSRICMCRYCGASSTHGQGYADFRWLGHPEISPNVHRRWSTHHSLLLSPRAVSLSNLWLSKSRASHYQTSEDQRLAVGYGGNGQGCRITEQSATDRLSRCWHNLSWPI